MRLTLCLALVIVIGACERAPSPPPSTQSATPAKDCTYEIVKPDASAAATSFRDWLKPQADKLFDGADALNNGDVFIADVNNDGRDDFVLAWHEGSGSYLNVLIFQRANDKWSPIEKLPFEDRLTAAHEYSGPLMTEPQLIARLCGKTIINLTGGLEPNYYPESLLWEGNTAGYVCSAPWLNRHRAAGADLVKRSMLDEARVLLDGIQKGCEKESPAEVQAIKDDIAAIDRTTSAASAAGYDFSWVMDEIKRKPDQQLVLDPRFGKMLVAIVPDAQLEHESLRGALKKSVWLPDDPKIIDDRYIVIAGCEPHNCENRGFVWIDTVSKQAIAMTNGLLASKTTAAGKIPKIFWEQTEAGNWPDEAVDFIGPDGKKTSIKKP